MILGLQFAQGKITGRMVVDDSLPVVVSHMFPVIEESVKSSIDRDGGRVVMVEFTDSGVKGMTGATVRVEPSVVTVSNPEIVEAGGRVKMKVKLSGSVNVSILKAEVGEVGSGTTTIVEPCFAIVCVPVTKDSAGRVSVSVCPSASVTIWVVESWPMLVVATEPIVSVESSVVIVEISDVEGGTNVTTEPSGAVAEWMTEPRAIERIESMVLPRPSVVVTIEALPLIDEGDSGAICDVVADEKGETDVVLIGLPTMALLLMMEGLLKASNEALDDTALADEIDDDTIGNELVKVIGVFDEV